MTSTSETIFRHKNGEIPKLDQFNFHLWKPAILIIARSINAFDILTRKEVEPIVPTPPVMPPRPLLPTDATDEQQTHYNAELVVYNLGPLKTYEDAVKQFDAATATYEADLRSYNKRFYEMAGIFYSSCKPITQVYLSGVTDPADMYDLIIERMDNASSRKGRLAILDAFEVSTPKQGNTLQEYFSTLIGYQNQLRGSGEALSDDKIMSHIWRTLSSTEWDTEIRFWQQKNDATLHEVMSAFLATEASRAADKTSPKSGSAYASTGKGPFCTEHGYRNHTTEECNYLNGRGRGTPRGHYRGRGSSRGGYHPYNYGPRDISHYTCYECNGKGHVARDCPQHAEFAQEYAKFKARKAAATEAPSAQKQITGQAHTVTDSERDRDCSH